MSDAPEQAALSVEELRGVCDILYQRTGMSYGEPKRYFLERRIRQGMRRSAMTSPAAYLRLLSAGGAETERLINSITINESYFWREAHQLRCLSRRLLPAVTRNRAPGDLVRIWSVPCASGEEPYSIAISLLESFPLVDAWNIEIVGSDIDTDVLEEAALGIYGERALSRMPAALVSRYFERTDEATWRIIADLRESVRLSQVNLVDARRMLGQGRFDIIFCRNVLIYFDDASRLLAADSLWDALAPGGFLCLGHTESMARIDPRFTLCRFEDAMVYQKPADSR